MKLGIFTTTSFPERRGEHYQESLECYMDLADEVVTMRGEETWPKEFNWPLIGQHFQKGYEQLNTDWVIHADLDFIFHEDDFRAIREACERNNDAPAMSFYKHQFILPDRYNLKSRLVIAVNKGKFGDRIKFNSGGDLCQPSLDGVEIKPDSVPEAGIPFYNYEKLIKNPNQVMDDVGRMDRAYKRHFGKFLYSDDGTDEHAFDGWMRMVTGRFNKPQRHIGIEDHPIYIQGVLATLRKHHFGYSGFGALEENDYVKSS